MTVQNISQMNIDNQDMTPLERVARMLVDHLTEFKGCNPAEHVKEYDSNDLSMSEFIEKRFQIFNRVPELFEPDFAMTNRLPKEAREHPSDVEDQWRKHLGDPIGHMSVQKWDQNWQHFQDLFTGDHDGLKQLAIGKDCDISHSNEEDLQRISRGKVMIDIDSILAMFTDLSVINSVLKISIVSNPAKNLSSNIHLAHRGKPLHHIPHFFLGSFGHDPRYDLYMMLPTLHNPKLKRGKGKLHNHVPENVRAEFMQKCFLPAVRKVLNANEAQSWVLNYNVAEANMTASSKEGNRFQSKAVLQEVQSDLDAKYIGAIWKVCKKQLDREMRKDGLLKAFRDFQFFITAKKYKHRMMADSFCGLMKVYKEKVISRACPQLI